MVKSRDKKTSILSVYRFLKIYFNIIKLCCNLTKLELKICFFRKLFLQKYVQISIYSGMFFNIFGFFVSLLGEKFYLKKFKHKKTACYKVNKYFFSNLCANVRSTSIFLHLFVKIIA